MKYILVNETSSKNYSHRINNCHFPDIGQHVVVGGHTDITETTDIKQCKALLRKLCELRKHHPEAKILGISELGDYNVHPSEAMNQQLH